MIFDPATIPPELRDKAQWVCWRAIKDDTGKWRKLPFNIYTGEACDITDPANFAPLDHALSCQEASQSWEFPYDGVGFALLRNQNITCIDLDHKPDAKQDLTPFHHGILNGFNSWTEQSPSGAGYHVWMLGEVPNKKRMDIGVEIYSCDRFITVTGRILNPVPLQERQHYLETLRAEMGKDVDHDTYIPDVVDLGSDRDNEICDRLFNMQNGQKFADLYTGEWEKHYSSQSEADYALVNMLTFAHPNKDQVQRIFLKSALGQRDKAKRIDYFDKMFRGSCDRMVPPVDFDDYKAKIAAAMEASKAEKAHAVTYSRNSAPSLSEASAIPGKPAPVEAYSWPVGLVGEIARFIYQSSPVPVYEVALAASIGLMAGICGRGTNVSRTGLNMYVLLLAKTGRGKESMKKGIDKLIASVSARNPAAKKFIGPATIASPQALNRHFEKSSRSFVSILGEFGYRMHQMSSNSGNTSQMGLRQMILDVYNKSGQNDVLGSMIYSDSDKNVEPVKSPAFSILGESNPHTFYEIMDERSVNDGLLPRFLLIEYTGPAMYVQENVADHRVPEGLANRFLDLTTEMASRLDRNAVVDVMQDDAAKSYLSAFSRYCTDQINDPNGNEVTSNLWNRAHLKALKLAALLATGVNWNNPMITLEHAEWAVNLVNRDTVMLLAKFDNGEIGDSQHSKQMAEFKRAIAKFLRAETGKLLAYGVSPMMQAEKVIPLAYLSRALTSRSAFKSERQQAPELVRKIIEHAVRAGHIYELDMASKIRLGLKSAQAFTIEDPAWFLRAKEAEEPL